MPEKVATGQVQDTNCIRETVCVHTRKIYDSCRDKDCIEDLRLYPTHHAQCIIDKAISVRCRNAELLFAYIDVDEVSFNRGFYTVDVRYFYRVTVDAFTGVCKSTEISGLCIFDKRVILFGSEGSAKVFTSRTDLEGADLPGLRKSNLPIGVVEAVDPVCLGARLVEASCSCPTDCEIADVPEKVTGCFDDNLVLSDEGKRVFVTLGQFSIIKLERDSQLTVPHSDFCIPEKECEDNNSDDPCELFRQIRFPMDEFFPPNSIENTDSYRETKNKCCR